jgi:hypothetical protein
MYVLTILIRQRTHTVTFCSSLGSFYMTNSISSPTLVKLSSWSTFYLSPNLYYNRGDANFQLQWLENSSKKRFI